MPDIISGKKILSGLSLLCAVTFLGAAITPKAPIAPPVSLIDRKEAILKGTNVAEISTLLVQLKENPNLVKGESNFKLVSSAFYRVDKFDTDDHSRKKLKKELLILAQEGGDHRVFKFFNSVAKTDNDAEIRLLAKDLSSDLAQLPLSERMDTTRFVKVGTQVLSYDEAYPVLARKLKQPTTDDKINAIKSLGYFGGSLQGKPIINDLVALYGTIPSPKGVPTNNSEGKNLELKTGILSVIAVSGDPKGTQILETALKDKNSIIREWGGKVKQDVAGVEGQIPPGGLPVEVESADTSKLILERSLWKRTFSLIVQLTFLRAAIWRG